MATSSFEGILREIPGLTASADLSDTGTLAGTLTPATVQNRFVALSGSLTVGAPSGAGVQCEGVLQNKPANGAAATVAGPGSIVKCYIGSGGVTFGQKVKTDANGAAVPVSGASDWVLGRALQTNNAGDLGIIELMPALLQTATP